MSSVRNYSHLAKRVRQTPTLCRNFPTIYRDLALSATPWAPRESVFRLRNGMQVTCPNVDGARYPIFEVFGDDAYRMEDLLAGLPDDAVVLDVGGQVGCFALLAGHVGPNVRVETYEASPVSADYIQRNIDDNGLGDRLRVHATALAASAGTITFFDSGTASGLNGLTGRKNIQAATSGEITVPAVTFDDAVAAAPGPVRLVKMDIEGGEYDAVLGSSPQSWADVQKVVMEYHPVEGHTLEELVGFLTGAGLKVVRDEPGTEPGLGVVWLER